MFYSVVTHWCSTLSAPVLPSFGQLCLLAADSSTLEQVASSCVNTFIQPWGAGTLSPMAANVMGARFRALSSSIINSSAPETGPPRPGSSLGLFQLPWPALSFLSPHSPLSFFSLKSLYARTVCSHHSLPTQPLLVMVFVLVALWNMSAASHHSGHCNLCPSPLLLLVSVSSFLSLPHLASLRMKIKIGQEQNTPEKSLLQRSPL